MRQFRLFLFRSATTALCALMLFSAPAGAEPSDSVKLELKAAVLDHIASFTEDDVYHFIDGEDTNLKRLEFLAMHPVIFERNDGVYALCADFIDTDGNKILVDYYLRELNGELVVLSSVEGRRSILMQIAEKFDL
ncbi:MAG: hypothetical protein RIC16_06855 [Rhodospirillales bacterium]